MIPEKPTPQLPGDPLALSGRQMDIITDVSDFLFPMGTEDLDRATGALHGDIISYLTSRKKDAGTRSCADLPGQQA